MGKNRDLIIKICVCAVFAALAVVLDKFVSIKVSQDWKVSLYPLPLIFVGLVFGKRYGFATGLVTGVVCQLTSEYGISISSPFWALAPVCWGFFAGMFNNVFKKYRFVDIILGIVVGAIAANLVNTFAMMIDAWFVKDSWYTISTILVGWGTRLLIMLVSIPIYCAISVIVVIPLEKVVVKPNK